MVLVDLTTMMSKCETVKKTSPTFMAQLKGFIFRLLFNLDISLDMNLLAS